MAPIGFHLLPKTAKVDQAGELLVGGCRLTDLAAEFKTPLLVYDQEHIVHQCRSLVASFGDQVFYATKAFICRHLAKLVAAEGLSFDFSSAGEMAVLIEAGVDPKKLVFHGNNKSGQELKEALVVGVGRIVVDSFDELDLIDKLVKQGHQRPKVWLRLTPGVEVHTHEYVKTGADDSKFGLTISSGLAAAAIKRCQERAVDLVGFHAHIGSQVFSLEAFSQATETVINFVKDYNLLELSIGGGLGVAYTNDETSPTFEKWAAAIKKAAVKSGYQKPIGVEPGRSLIGPAAVSLYQVGTIKELPNLRTYVAVDGGMSDNIRPALYGSRYEAFLPKTVTAERTLPVKIVGKHCESGDFLVAAGQLPESLELEDILGLAVTGAYGYSMASNYNRLPRPAVVFVNDGQAKLILRRETIADLGRLEVAG